MIQSIIGLNWTTNPLIYLNVGLNELKSFMTNLHRFQFDLVWFIHLTLVHGNVNWAYFVVLEAQLTFFFSQILVHMGHMYERPI